MRVRLHKSNDHVSKWKKHGASSSNPKQTKHRDAARLQLLASLPSSKQSSIDIVPTITNHDVDRISQYSKTTAGTTATNATAIQVTGRVIQVKIIDLLITTIVTSKSTFL
jgi:hypothetical protein